MVDGYSVAEALKNADRSAFDLLSRISIPFRFHDNDWDLRWRAPTIALDEDGSYQEIRYHAALAAAFDIKPEMIEPFYRAYKKFGELLRSDRYLMQIKLSPGDLMVFNNRRVLHGRKAFDPNSGKRRLQGCYVDNDELYSRLRMLE